MEKTSSMELVKKLDSFINKQLSRKYWALIITLYAVLLSLFLAFPSLDTFQKNVVEGTRSREVALQISDLQYYWENVTARNTAFRISVPVIASLLGLDVRGAYGLQVISGIFLFYFIARIVERVTNNRKISLFFTLAIAATYAGSTAFTELRSTYDAVALFFLVVALWSSSPFIIVPAILLASFTDERAIVASGFVFLWWAMRSPKNTGPRSFKAFANSQSISVVAGLFVYFIIRLLIVRTFGTQSHMEANQEFLLFDQINNIPMGLWTGLEAGWAITVVAAYFLAKRRKLLFLGVFLVFFSIQTIGGLAVVDITRSLTYLLPSLFVALIVVQPELKENLRPLMMYIMLINILFVSYYAGGKSTIWWQYPLPLQIIRWIFLT